MMIGQKVNIPKEFPNSRTSPFTVTSLPTPIYNCIAWAAEDNSRWYWPVVHPIAYWPANLPRTVELESFVLLFQSLGYIRCNDSSHEIGYQKVVIYADANNVPTHAARQLNNGLWTSKIGQSIDVSHDLPGMDGGDYGTAIIFMCKPI